MSLGSRRKKADGYRLHIANGQPLGDKDVAHLVDIVEDLEVELEKAKSLLAGEWVESKDENVRHVWVDLNTGDIKYVPPSYYLETGRLPQSDEGDDLHYMRTEIRCLDR